MNGQIIKRRDIATARKSMNDIPDLPTPPSPNITILKTRRPPRVVCDCCTDWSPLFSFLSLFLFLLFFRDVQPIDSPAILATLFLSLSAFLSIQTAILAEYVCVCVRAVFDAMHLPRQIILFRRAWCNYKKSAAL